MNGESRQPIEQLIDRAVRGEASRLELQRLAAWRSASSDNEQLYRRTERLITSARALAVAASEAPAPPAAATIVRGARGVRRRSAAFSRLARWAPWAVAAAAVLVAALDLRPAAEPAGRAPAEVVTGAHEMATIKLGDGSVVRLAPSSRLQVTGSERTREVTLDGRAFFAIASVPEVPFLVHTRTATAKVLGTRFELTTEQDEVRLMVLEGRVALEAPENSIEVGAGEQSGVRYGAATRPTPLEDSERVTAWLGRFLVFHATPLREAARDIERLYGTPVLVSDSALAAETITATFTDRPLDDVVGIICSVLNARCATGADAVSIGR